MLNAEVVLDEDASLNLHHPLACCAGNIHCHLIPAVMILVMLATQAIRPWQEAKLAFFEIVIPIILCFAGSVTYHTFMANNQNYHRWLFIDVRPRTSLQKALFHSRLSAG